MPRPSFELSIMAPFGSHLDMCMRTASPDEIASPDPLSMTLQATSGKPSTGFASPAGWAISSGALNVSSMAIISISQISRLSPQTLIVSPMCMSGKISSNNGVECAIDSIRSPSSIVSPSRLRKRKRTLTASR